MNAHCDVLVVGGGPAGLAAALAAGRAGARVILADEQSEFGGSLLAVRDATADGADSTLREAIAGVAIDGAAPIAWVRHTLAALAGRCPTCGCCRAAPSSAITTTTS